MPATDATPTEPTLLDYLDQVVPARKPDEAATEYLQRLERAANSKEAKAGEATRAATAHRVKLALDLVAEQPEDPKEAKRWRRETAKQLGWKGTRSLRNYLDLGEAIRKVETAFPASILDVPIRKMQKAIENYDPTTGTFTALKKEKVAPSTAEERRDLFVSRVSAAAAKLYSGHEAELAAALRAVAEQLGVAGPKGKAGRKQPGPLDTEPGVIEEMFGAGEPRQGNSPQRRGTSKSK